jgi:hypothetical protein
MEWIAADLKKQLQISIELKKEDPKTYWQKLRTDPYEIFLSGVTPFTIHPYGYYSEFLSTSVANWGKYKSLKYDEIVERMSERGVGSNELAEVSINE